MLFHGLPSLVEKGRERKKKGLIQFRRDDDDRKKGTESIAEKTVAFDPARDPPEWSMHNPISLSISWPFVTYRIKNGSSF